jgi:hypothetical protein
MIALIKRGYRVVFERIALLMNFGTRNFVQNPIAPRRYAILFAQIVNVRVQLEFVRWRKMY